MTEQEQTKQMLKTLCDKFQCSAIDRSYMAKSCRQCEDIVKALHEAGYGNISEYKAEIERLKAEVKQAQIDILNKLKERAIGYTFLGEKLATETDIDELIKEIENETV